MKIKKILSLAVVLAMVMAVVPMFGLTAGAAEAGTVTLGVKPDFIDKVISGDDIKFNGDRASFPSIGETAEDVSAYTGWKAYYNYNGNLELELNADGWSETSDNLARGGLQKYNKKAANEDASSDKNYIKFQTANNGSYTGKDQNTKMTTPGYGVDKETLEDTYLAIEWVRQHNYTNQDPFYHRFKFYDKDDKEFATFLYDKNDSSAFTGIKSPDEPEPLQRIVVINGSDISNPMHTVYYQENTGSGYITVEKMTTSSEGFVNGFKSLKEFSQSYNALWEVIGLGDFKVYAGEIPYVDVNTKYVAGDVNLGSNIVRGIEGDTIDFVNSEDCAPSIIQHTDGIYVKSENAELSNYQIKSSANEVSVQYTKETLTVDDIELTTRVGVAARLPKTVSAKGATSEKDYPGLEVNWTTNADKVPVDTTAYEVQGTLKDYSNVTVKANVTVKNSAEDFLIAKYDFENNLKDTSGNNNDAAIGDTLGDKVSYVDGISGQAVSLNKAYLSINHDILNGHEAVTITSDIMVQEIAETTRLFDFGTGEQSYIYAIPMVNSVEAGYAVSNGKKIDKTLDSSLIKKWINITVVADGTTMYLYTNGELAGSVEGGIPVQNLASATNNYIGKSQWSGEANDSHYLNAYLDNFKVYSVPLTADEVAEFKIEENDVSLKTSELGEVTVISGNSPVLPTQATVIGEYGSEIQKPVSWETESADFKTPTEDTSVTVNGTVEGVVDGNVTAKVNVLPCSYSLEDMESNGVDNTSGWSGAQNFKADITGEFTIEFDLQINKQADVSVQFCDVKGKRWTDGAFGVGTNGALDISGGTDGKGTRKQEIFFDHVESAGEIYRVLIQADVSQNLITKAMAISPAGEVKTVENLHFRNDKDKLSVIDVCENNGTEKGKIKMLNAKVYDPSVAPSQPVATLGYDGGAFTMDIAYGEIAGDSIKVQSDASGSAAKFEKTEKTTDGATLKTGATNRNYTITAVNGSTDGTPLTTSIYELVVKAVATEEGTMKSDKLAAANKVIAEGGIIDIASIETDDVRNQIMQKIESQDVTGIEIKGDIFNKGIGFVTDGVNLYIGSNPDKATIDTTDSGAGKVYKYMKIADTTVTLSNDLVSLQDAVTLSLDSVNIEFIETIIEETEADADGALDLVPEL